MVTVIIPALNEQDTIAGVVKFCCSDPLVSEVIVVDDESTDATREYAAAAGARVIVSKVRGKGTSMKEGASASCNQILVFLDADINPYPKSTIARLVTPLMENECDFVKGTFARNAGRVTELVAKPLLKIFYPELSVFQQPLSGMIAGKKKILEKIVFLDDYGVDVGILIDMFMMQARIKEVNIGYIDNKSKPWRMLGAMSAEVARAIIKKATSRKEPLVNLEELGSVNEISVQMEKVMKEEMRSLRKMIVFDMDNTLLQGRFIDTCAKRFSFEDKLAQLRKTESDPAVLTKRVAELLRGISMGELLQVVASIPLVDDAADVIEEMRLKGNVVGIISDSYQFVADYVKNKAGADFAIGNHLEFFEGAATGEVTIPSWFYYSMHSKCSHGLCKTNALMHIAHKFGISIENCMVIGDGENDKCMIKEAGMGVAFCTENTLLKKVADKVIDKPSFSELLDCRNFYVKPGTLKIAV
ncbi:MAG TPA: HAD-IB family phosphatase [Ferruginibacter sp.]|nr:HAD-IB family phosphatase [Ferruginibacter sp.]HPH91191.1 HAD-IB family phosphatase [Ferruginibacter sp.]